MSKMEKRKQKTTRQERKRKQHIDVQLLPSERALVNAEWLPADVDSHLLETAKIQWQFGDWEALAKLSTKVIQSHPERANLAMLCAAAHQQLGQLSETRQLMRLAQGWGASKEQVVRVLAGGVHNVLGRIHALSENSENALKHFRQALSLDHPVEPPSYLIKARVAAELEGLGEVNEHAGELTLSGIVSSSRKENTHDGEDDHVTDNAYQQAQHDWATGNWQKLTQLDNVTLVEHPQRIMLGIYAACGHQQQGDGEAEQRCVKIVRQWGASTSQIKRFMLSGIYNRLARANALLGDHDEALGYFHKSLNTVSGDMPDAARHIQLRISSQLADMSKDDLKAILQKLES